VTRQALQLESGLNDVVLLPIVVVAIALTGHYVHSSGGFARLGLGLFILGPGAGIAIGLLGVAFTAFAAAEAVHGSGFLAAFSAGLTIAALDVELCDCFIEYGAVTAEMLLLFTFVILGASLIWTGFSGLNLPTLIFAAFSILIRVPVYLLSLYGSNVDRRGRLLIAWYGPSGLSSLLLVLLAVFSGLPGSDRLFAICSLIVLISVVVHGASPMLLTRFARKREPEASPAPEIPREPRPLPVLETNNPVGTQSISLEELDQLQKSGEKVILLDVRTERSRETSDDQAQGSVRLPPDDAISQARQLDLPKEAWLLAYCA
jgi:NhaP-type Na+/H+ or K+/H+ antiporter